MADYSKYKFIKVEKKDKVAILTLNRPEALNAFNGEMIAELQAIFEDVGGDDEVTAVMLTGAGKAFSVGGDLRWLLAELDDPTRDHFAEVHNSVGIISN
ncbi:enoyl-CoA hydratase/isomerase family protein, partial [Chloroflexota bacterium]